MGKKKEERGFDRGKLKDTKENICGEGEEMERHFSAGGECISFLFFRCLETHSIA